MLEGKSFKLSTSDFHDFTANISSVKEIFQNLRLGVKNNCYSAFLEQLEKHPLYDYYWANHIPEKKASKKFAHEWLAGRNKQGKVSLNHVWDLFAFIHNHNIEKNEENINRAENEIDQWYKAVLVRDTGRNIVIEEEQLHDNAPIGLLAKLYFIGNQNNFKSLSQNEKNNIIYIMLLINYQSGLSAFADSFIEQSEVPFVHGFTNITPDGEKHGCTTLNKVMKVSKNSITFVVPGYIQRFSLEGKKESYATEISFKIPREKLQEIAQDPVKWSFSNNALYKNDFWQNIAFKLTYHNLPKDLEFKKEYKEFPGFNLPKSEPLKQDKFDKNTAIAVFGIIFLIACVPAILHLTGVIAIGFLAFATATAILITAPAVIAVLSGVSAGFIAGRQPDPMVDLVDVWQVDEEPTKKRSNDIATESSSAQKKKHRFEESDTNSLATTSNVSGSIAKKESTESKLTVITLE